MLSSRGFWICIAVALLLGGALFYQWLLPSEQGRQADREGGPETGASLAEIVAPLRDRRDVGTCRAVLRELNTYLAKHPAETKAELSPERERRLTEKILLPEDLLTELRGDRFTQLDGRWLEQCFLLRDGVQSIGLELPPYTQESPPPPRVARAEAALGWALRQVAAVHAPEADSPLMEVDQPVPLLPTELLLQLGTSSHLGRATVFLGMLEQMSIPAGLLGLEEGETTRYWACAVLGEDGELYLFDPRLGIALPGPGGKGVATLKQFIEDPSVSEQLAAGEKEHYEITPEQAAASSLEISAPLNGWAPRMRDLERIFSESGLQVRVAVEPGERLRELDDALKRSGIKEPEASVAMWSVFGQMRFYAESEGGKGSPILLQQQILNLIPLQNFVNALPPELLGGGNLEIALQATGVRDLRERYSEFFLRLLIEPGSPRDQMLRGQFSESSRELSDQRDVLEDFERAFQQANRAEMGQSLVQWQRRLRELARASSSAKGAEQERVASEIKEAWNQHNEAITLVVRGSAARPLLERVYRMIALASHDQESRAWYHFKTGEKKRTPEELRDLRRDWKETDHWWRVYLREHGGESQAAIALRHRATCHERIAELLELEAELAEAESKPDLIEEAKATRNYARALWRDYAAQEVGPGRLVGLLRGRE